MVHGAKRGGPRAICNLPSSAFRRRDAVRLHRAGGACVGSALLAVACGWRGHGIGSALIRAGVRRAGDGAISVPGQQRRRGFSVEAALPARMVRSR